MKKAKKKVKAVNSTKPSDFLAAGYTVAAFDGSLLLQRGTDLRLFHFEEYREGGGVQGKIIVKFTGKIP
jgi:hypothetical protein